MRSPRFCAIICLSFTSEIATAAFPLELCDRGALPSNDAPFNVEMPAAGRTIVVRRLRKCGELQRHSLLPFGGSVFFGS